MRATQLVDAIHFAMRDPIIAKEIYKRDTDKKIQVKGVLSSYQQHQGREHIQVVLDYEWLEAGDDERAPDLIVYILVDPNNGFIIAD
jgi:hypothetical protein